jgi:hypothetical protein
MWHFMKGFVMKKIITGVAVYIWIDPTIKRRIKQGYGDLPRYERVFILSKFYKYMPGHDQLNI